MKNSYDLILPTMLVTMMAVNITLGKTVSVDIFSEKKPPPDKCPDIPGISCLSSTAPPTPTTATAPSPHPGAPDFISALSAWGGYTRGLYLLAKAGLAATLLNAPNLTLFLPTDAALAKVSPQYINDISVNHTALVDLLSYHACLTQKEKIGRADNDKVLMSSNSKPIRLNKYYTQIYASEGIKITDKNIKVNNGYVHGIDGIMTPPTRSIVGAISERPELSTLISLMTKTGLMADINTDTHVTMFAPSDAAFARLDPAVMGHLGGSPGDLRDVLQYHQYSLRTMYSIGLRHSQYLTADDGLTLMIFQEGNVTSVNNAKITECDVSATNGVMHVIDHVLMPTRVLLNIEANTDVSFG